MQKSNFQKLHNLGVKLFPICRSITGSGTLQTLKILKKYTNNLNIFKVKSRTKVYDWVIPDEWEIRDAYIIDIKSNKKIIDFKDNNLHLMNYSKPVNELLNFIELKKKIFTSEILHDAIPYVTSYYKKNWGFCLSEINKKKLIKKYNKVGKERRFRVVINSNFKKNGYLYYAEKIINGLSKKEILVTSYICHPSMANNELSGPLVLSELIKHYSKYKPHKTIRFVLHPETIGAICYIKKNYKSLKSRVIGGYALTCIGDNKNYTLVKSNYGNSISDKSALKALRDMKVKFKNYDFTYRGSDERQYNHPKINLKISSLCRSKHGDYKEYHTSKDDFKLVTVDGLKGGFNFALNSIEILLNNFKPIVTTYCEPNLGKRNLYPLTNSKPDKKKQVFTYLNFLTYADGNNDLIDISYILKTSFNETLEIANLMLKNKLIKKI